VRLIHFLIFYFFKMKISGPSVTASSWEVYLTRSHFLGVLVSGREKRDANIVWNYFQSLRQLTLMVFL